MKALRLWSLAVVLFCLLPLMSVAQKGLSVDGWQRLLAREDIHQATLQSLILAFLNAGLATIAGTMIATAMPKFSSNWQKFFQLGLVFPMVLPEIAFALSFLVWFVTLQWPFGWGTLLVAHVGFSLSYATLVMKTRVDLMDHSLFDAARDLGSKRWDVLRHAFFPQIRPALLTSWVTCFSLSLDDFFISFFVKGLDQNFLPVQLYSMMRMKLQPEVYTLSFLLIGLSVLLVIGSQWWLQKQNQSLRRT